MSEKGEWEGGGESVRGGSVGGESVAGGDDEDESAAVAVHTSSSDSDDSDCTALWTMTKRRGPTYVAMQCTLVVTTGTGAAVLPCCLLWFASCLAAADAALVRYW